MTVLAPASLAIRYRLARPGEEEGLGRLAAESFGDYPFFSFALREPFDSYQKYLDYMTRLHRMLIKAYIKKQVCLVGVSDGTVVSVALLHDPRSRDIGVTDYILAGGLGLVRGVGLRRLLAFFDISEAAQSACTAQHPDAWYVELLAVDTQLKGRGLGGKMIHDCVEPYVRGHDGRSLSLITNTEQNRRFYTSKGFTEFSESTLSCRGQTIGNWSFFKQLEI
ncbi:GNAT family N-acetyltransferase [Bifidobacterium crudilactis]|jgi:ribosomal protein S18 acetylase RimI-like enzyme|uniref:GNAT family N-acetyltransferase n=1 Tax=Bifidobacterium crudilactis TaxID=327277 RepID=UPI002F359616|nr:GNAT family N-acetyltransferase [Bifidobacterium crudilactis]